MNKLSVTNIQRLCVHDGPGVRTVVFLQGCTLQCPWCCNPETIHADAQVYDKGLCAYPEKKIYCADCEKFGGTRNTIDCPIHACESVSRQYTQDELLEELLSDQYIYGEGGVTFSGGEPLLHADALVPVIQELKRKGVSVAMETTLYVPTENVAQILPYVDYWLVDLKFQYGYITNKEYSLPEKTVENNLLLLRKRVDPRKVKYRMVMMHEAIKNKDCIVAKLKEHNITDVELLECHSLAENKYKQLGLNFRRFVPLTEGDLDLLHTIFDAENIKHIYIRI